MKARDYFKVEIASARLDNLLVEHVNSKIIISPVEHQIFNINLTYFQIEAAIIRTRMIL